MGCLTKAFVMALGVAAAVGLTSKFHPERPHRAEPAPHCARTAPVTLHIWADGSVTFDGTHFTDRKLLAARFKAFMKQVPQRREHLTADKPARYDDVVAVLTIAQRYGMDCMGFTGIEKQPD